MILNKLLFRYQQEIDQQTTTKIKTLVKSGNCVDNNILLTLNDKNYKLQSVIFHIGKESIKVHFNKYLFQGKQSPAGIT